MNATKMKHFDRGTRDLPVTIKPLSPLVPRHALEPAGSKELLDAYDTMVTLNNAIHDHRRQITEKNAQANDAAVDYKNKVAEALAAGTDPGKVKNREPQLRAEAEAHRTFADEALTKANAHGVTLGALLKEHAADCFEPAQAAATAALEEIAAVLQGLRETWAECSRTWAIRKHLSQIHHQGGHIHWAPRTLPGGLEPAIAAVNEAREHLDALAADEQTLTEWRAENAAAEQKNHDRLPDHLKALA